MTEERPFYCPHCHLRVAPGDPHRVATKDAAAHQSCIMRARGADVRGVVSEVLGKYATDGVAAEFTTVASRTPSYGMFVRTIQNVLRRTYANGKGAETVRRKAVTACATDVGAMLMCAIVCGDETAGRGPKRTRTVSG